MLFNWKSLPKLSGWNPTKIYLVSYFSYSSLECLISILNKDWVLRLSGYLYSSLLHLCSVCYKHCWQWVYLLGNVKGLSFLILPLASQAPAYPSVRLYHDSKCLLPFPVREWPVPPHCPPIWSHTLLCPMGCEEDNEWHPEQLLPDYNSFFTPPQGAPFSIGFPQI